MLALLVIPILICGFILINSIPQERYYLSLHQGWALYLRASTFGVTVVASAFLYFCVILPKIYLFLGDCTGINIFPDTNLIKYLASMIHDSTALSFKKTDEEELYLQIVSLSIISFFLAIVVSAAFKKFTSVEKRASYIKEIFRDKAPIEYILFTIGDDIAKGLKAELLFDKKQKLMHKNNP